MVGIVARMSDDEESEIGRLGWKGQTLDASIGVRGMVMVTGRQWIPFVRMGAPLVHVTDGLGE